MMMKKKKEEEERTELIAYGMSTMDKQNTSWHVQSIIFGHQQTSFYLSHRARRQLKKCSRAAAPKFCLRSPMDSLRGPQRADRQTQLFSPSKPNKANAPRPPITIDQSRSPGSSLIDSDFHWSWSFARRRRPFSMLREFGPTWQSSGDTQTDGQPVVLWPLFQWPKVKNEKQLKRRRRRRRRSGRSIDKAINLVLLSAASRLVVLVCFCVCRHWISRPSRWLTKSV